MKAISMFLCVFAYVCGIDSVYSHDFLPYDVGALHEHWKFTSDHLPIGAKMDRLRLASWNVLNEKYLHFIIDDGQGLNTSLITRLAEHRAWKSLSKREWVIARQCKAMMEGKYRRALIGLLETSDSLHHYLCRHLPSGWKSYSSTAPNQQEDVFLYDARKLKIIDATIVPYSNTSPKVVFLLKVQDRATRTTYAIVLTHAPGKGPEGLAQMATMVRALFDPTIDTVLMGDMNASPCAVVQALHHEGLAFDIAATEYPTHVNTQKRACWYDSFFVYSPSGRTFLRPDASQQLFGRMRTHIASKRESVCGVYRTAHLLQKCQ
jgi:endonuclease/exonuclease/phosphatase family metal-dependent hydrolase